MAKDANAAGPSSGQISQLLLNGSNESPVNEIMFQSRDTKWLPLVCLWHGVQTLLFEVGYFLKQIFTSSILYPIAQCLRMAFASKGAYSNYINNNEDDHDHDIIIITITFIVIIITTFYIFVYLCIPLHAISYKV